MAGVAGRTGATWERIVADWFMDAGLPWDRMVQRGNHDLLDLTGTLPAGFLVGCKGIRRGTAFGEKISGAMDQCDRALLNLGHPHLTVRGRPIVESNGIIPVQVMQRSGYPVAKSYTVMQTGHFLDLVQRRLKWRGDE